MPPLAPILAACGPHVKVSIAGQDFHEGPGCKQAPMRAAREVRVGYFGGHAGQRAI